MVAFLRSVADFTANAICSLRSKHFVSIMRLAIFSESYEPIVNGVSVCVATLRDGLRHDGHDVTVYAPAFSGHTDTYESVVRVPSVRTPLMPWYPYPIPYSPSSEKIFKSHNHEIIHTQTPFLLGMMGLRWGKRQSIPVVSTNHTLYTEYVHYAPIRPKAFTKGTLRLLMRTYYNQCNLVVVPSHPVADILRSYGVLTPMEVVKTGVDPVDCVMDESSRNDVRRNLVGSADGNLLLYVGRIAREKNLTMMLRALKMARTQDPGIRLVLVGGGPALDETRKFAASIGLDEGSVAFTGEMKRENVRHLLCSADVFVFPSKTETQGIAICEAMTTGLPVIAVNAGGIPENVTDGIDGYLTEDDPVQFAQRICELCSDPAKRFEMGEKARISAARFSVAEMIRKMEQVYQTALTGSVKKSCK